MKSEELKFRAPTKSSLEISVSWLCAFDEVASQDTWTFKVIPTLFSLMYLIPGKR